MSRTTGSLTTRYLHLRKNGKAERPYYIRKVPTWLQPIVGVGTWWIALPHDREAARREADRLTRNHDKLTGPDIRRLVMSEHGGNMATGKRAPQRTRKITDLRTGQVYETDEPPAIAKVRDMLLAMAMPPIEVPDVPADLHTWPHDQMRFFLALRAIAEEQSESVKADAVRLSPLVEALEESEQETRLSDLLRDWLRDPTKVRAAGTQRKYAMVARRLQEAWGDPPVTSITTSMVWQFRDTIAALPRQAGLPASLRKARLSQLIDWKDKHPGHPTVLPSVVDGHLIAVRSALSWFMKRNPDAMSRNPAGNIESVDDPRGKDPHNHAALPYADLPALMSQLAADDSPRAKALTFVILTAARTDQVLGATWSEIDPDKRLWTIPAARMKASRTHLVPLSQACVAILASLPRSGALVFGGMPEAALRRLLARYVEAKVATVHGMRACFRTYMDEETGHDETAAKIALAHKVGDKVDEAYRRGAKLAKRYTMMEDWATFCLSAAAGKRE